MPSMVAQQGPGGPYRGWRHHRQITVPANPTHLGRPVAVVGRRPTSPSRGIAAVSLCARAAGRARQALSSVRCRAAGTRIDCQRIEDRQLVGQRFARCRAGTDNHITAGVAGGPLPQPDAPMRTDTALGECADPSGSCPCQRRRRAEARRDAVADVPPVAATAAASSSLPNVTMCPRLLIWVDLTKTATDSGVATANSQSRSSPQRHPQVIKSATTR